jgi:hypothetical protein
MIDDWSWRVTALPGKLPPYKPGEHADQVLPELMDILRCMTRAMELQDQRIERLEAEIRVLRQKPSRPTAYEILLQGD